MHLDRWHIVNNKNKGCSRRTNDLQFGPILYESNLWSISDKAKRCSRKECTVEYQNLSKFVSSHWRGGENIVYMQLPPSSKSLKSRVEKSEMKFWIWWCDSTFIAMKIIFDFSEPFAHYLNFWYFISFQTNSLNLLNFCLFFVNSEFCIMISIWNFQIWNVEKSGKSP